MSKKIVEKVEKVNVLSSCGVCKHKYLTTPGCKAFPEVIPGEILLGEKVHNKPLADQDNDIVFKDENE